MGAKKRRGKHEGSIYKLKDGRWRAAVSLGFQRGQRIRKTFTAATRAEVQAKLNQALRDHALGLPVVVERQTVAQFLHRWLEDSARPAVRPKTFESYSQLVKLYLAPDLGNIPLAKLTPQHVQKCLNDRLTSGLSARTVQYIHAVLRRALNQALRWGMVSRNVATLVTPPKLRRPEFQSFTREQAQCFLASIQEDRLEALYTVALALGLREGEAFGLRWQDVDLDNGLLCVRQCLTRTKDGPVFGPPKTERSRRTIPLPAVCIAALQRHRARQEQERLLAGSRWQEHGLVFTTTIGTPLDSANVLKRFRAALKAAGLPPMRFHDLRHSCASLLLAQGVHPRVVMEVLGHSQISLTLDTYSHVYMSVKQEAAAKMDAILNPLATQLATKDGLKKAN